MDSSRGKRTHVWVLMAYASVVCGLPCIAKGTPLDVNLIVNGDAETSPIGSGGNVAVPGWTDTGEMSTITYGIGSGFPTLTDPGPPDRGTAFFYGGYVANSVMSQDISLADLAGTIDSGGLQFVLSGWLGGYYSHRDNMVLAAHFLNGTGGEIGSASIGPVTVADRGDVTSFLFRSTGGSVPTGTRTMSLLMTATRLDGDCDDGYSDDLSFKVNVPEPCTITLLSVAAATIMGKKRLRPMN